MLKGEPNKGKFYIVRTFDAKGRPEGATLCKYLNREGRGCQLHGDRMGYTYFFEKFGGGATGVWVDFPEGEKDSSKIVEQLKVRVIPYDGTIDPWSFELLPVKQQVVAA